MDYLSALTGQTTEHLTRLNDRSHLLHTDVVDDFISLEQACFDEGFTIAIHSSFRDYNTQLKIWNEKAQGKRALLDKEGLPLDFSQMTKKQILFSILRWSALPGMSRHHWGTDIDIYDSNSLPSNDYKVQLTPEEVNPTGIFGKLHLFLDELIKDQKSFNFYRPYKDDLGGVSPEKWHISHVTTANTFLEKLSYENFELFLKTRDPKEFALLDLVKQNRKLIFEKYITNISIPMW
jgi:LAS superfamily LD-carboxypeptidase LdcB